MHALYTRVGTAYPRAIIGSYYRWLRGGGVVIAILDIFDGEKPCYTTYFLFTCGKLPCPVAAPKTVIIDTLYPFHLFPHHMNAYADNAKIPCMQR